MSLKTDFYDGATGLQTKLNDAFDAGSAFVGTNTATLSTALIDNAAKGQTKFTVNIVTGFNPSYLRANNGDNLLTKAYFAGIQSGLATQDIYNYECSLVLNTKQSDLLSVDFNFNFATT